MRPSSSDSSLLRRGTVWWAELPEPRGSEPGYRRPVVIVQTDEFNRSRIGTVVAVVLTANLALSEAPGNVLLSAQETGLPRDSVANVSQVITLDKTMLAASAKRLPAATMHRVSNGLRLVLGV